MNTASLQLKVQRNRFAHHLVDAFPAPVSHFLRALVEGGPLARPLSRAEIKATEAEKVRDLAYRYSRTEPGFAADLYAAAARHEGVTTD